MFVINFTFKAKYFTIQVQMIANTLFKTHQEDMHEIPPKGMERYQTDYTTDKQRFLKPD